MEHLDLFELDSNAVDSSITQDLLVAGKVTAQSAKANPLLAARMALTMIAHLNTICSDEAIDADNVKGIFEALVKLLAIGGQTVAALRRRAKELGREKIEAALREKDVRLQSMQEELDKALNAAKDKGGLLEEVQEKLDLAEEELKEVKEELEVANRSKHELETHLKDLKERKRKLGMTRTQMIEENNAKVKRMTVSGRDRFGSLTSRQR